VFWLVIFILDIPAALLLRRIFRRSDEADQRRLVQ